MASWVITGQDGAALGDTDVGVVLRADGGRVDLVVSALRDDNPGVDLRVVDHGTMVEVWAPRALHLTAATLGWHIGRPVGQSELRNMIQSWHGRRRAASDRLLWLSTEHR